MKIKKIVATLCIGTQLIMLTACGSGNSAAEMKLMQPATKQSVIDYYANSLKYDAVITRAADEDKHETKYEEHEITDEDIIKRVEDAYKEAESVLSETEYSGTNTAITEDVFNYIKAYLNDLQIGSGSVESMTTALGYYFVDVKYEISSANQGEFNNNATLIGLRGAFTEDLISGEVLKNDAFLMAAVESGNKYFLENKIQKHLTYDDMNLFQVLDGSPVGSNTITDTTDEGSVEDTGEMVDNEVVDEEGTDNVDNNAENTDETTDENTDENVGEDAEAGNDEEAEASTDEENVSTEETSTGEETSTEEQTVSSEATNETEVSSDVNDTTSQITESSRKPKFDVRYINSIVGASAENKIEMPKLSVVYNIPANSGTASGVGIYPCGIGGMKLFGYDRNSVGGYIELRYVFKESEDGSGEISNINIYVKELSTQIPQFATESNVIIPEYLEKEFESLLERADRAITNCDLTSMMSGDIFDDIGFAVLRGYYEKSTDVLKHMSVIRQVIARDIDNNAYIMEIETTAIEGAKSSDVQGTYRDKSYIVVQQFGDKFKITDWVRVSRDVTDEPDIDAGNSTLKRITALNLTGEVSEENKEQAETLLNELYTASTYRYVNGPYTIETSDGSTVEYQRGMYDCFNNDTYLLSSDKKEEINSRLRSYLTAYGTNVKCEYIGIVDEWIGGYKNQVELTTEEIMVYGDKEVGRYFRTYYLMSKMNDVWYIDEMKVLDTEELDAGSISQYYDRISSGKKEVSNNAVDESTEAVESTESK